MLWLIVAEKKKKTVEGINAIYAEKKDRKSGSSQRSVAFS